MLNRFLSWKFRRLTIKATRAARDQINRFAQFVVNGREKFLEVNSFIIRQAFGTLMAIEIVRFVYETKFRSSCCCISVWSWLLAEHESDMQEMLIKNVARASREILRVDQSTERYSWTRQPENQLDSRDRQKLMIIASFASKVLESYLLSRHRTSDCWTTLRDVLPMLYFVCLRNAVPTFFVSLQFQS